MAQVIHCAHSDCQKLLARNVSLAPGSSLEIKCAHCGKINCVCSDRSGVHVKENGDNNFRRPGLVFLKIE